LFVLGVDHPLLWGLLVFLLSYVPYIGLFVAMTPPVLLALAEYGWVRAGLVILAAAVVNLTIENVIEPGYTGQRLQLSAAVVLVAFFVAVWLLGAVGAALAMPLTVMILLVCARYPETRWIAMLMSGGKNVSAEEVKSDAVTKATEVDAAAV
jgi:predicted PurR-regulated permease PerM